MNKRIYLISSVVVISVVTLLSACVKAQNHKSAESKAVSNVEAKKQDDNANRVTYDLAFVEAHGPVHTIQYLDGDTYVFDKNGNIVTFNGYDPFTADVYGQPEKLLNKFNRDSEGRICKVVGAMFDTDYTWEGKRIVKYVRGIESGCRTMEYHYGAKGLIEYATNTTEYETYEDDDPTEVTREKEVYEYKKFDNYDNWTERTENGDLTKRTITYYTSN